MSSLYEGFCCERFSFARNNTSIHCAELKLTIALLGTKRKKMLLWQVAVPTTDLLLYSSLHALDLPKRVVNEHCSTKERWVVVCELGVAALRNQPEL
jgi:hypothetical protein